MYDNPRHKKEQIIKARLDFYDHQEFRELAETMRLQPAVLARYLIKQFIAEARQQELALEEQQQLKAG